MLRAKGRVNARRRAEGAQGMSAEGKESNTGELRNSVSEGKLLKLLKKRNW